MNTTNEQLQNTIKKFIDYSEVLYSHMSDNNTIEYTYYQCKVCLKCWKKNAEDNHASDCIVKEAKDIIKGA